MDRKRQQLGWPFWFAAFFVSIATLIAPYVSAYLWMVEPVLNLSSFGEGIDPEYFWGNDGGEASDQAYWRFVFSPIHDLDRKIRPKMWSAEEWSRLEL